MFPTVTEALKNGSSGVPPTALMPKKYLKYNNTNWIHPHTNSTMAHERRMVLSS